MKASVLIIIASIAGITAFAQTGNQGNGNNGNQGNGDNGNHGNGNNGNHGDGNNGNGNGNGGSKGDAILGLQENTTINSISTYPNPASDNLFISNIPATASSFVLVSMDGTEANRGFVNGSQLNLNVKEFNSGVYTIQLLDQNQAVLYKNRLVISN